MLTIFYGRDQISVRDRMSDFVDGFKKEGFSISSVDVESYAPGIVRDMVGSVSLFQTPILYCIDEPTEDQDFLSETQDVLSNMAESENNFLIVEGVLTTPVLKVFKQHAQVIEEINPSVTQSASNPFALAEALVKKDKKTLWILMQKYLDQGQAPEVLIGTLWWQLKILRLAEKTKTPQEAGVKPYPYQKAKSALVKFRKGELEKLSKELLELYHVGHSGVKDIRVLLEVWILRL